METLKYLVTGFPGALAECHHWLVKVTGGVWPFVLMPGHRAWHEIKFLRGLGDG